MKNQNRVTTSQTLHHLVAMLVIYTFSAPQFANAKKGPPAEDTPAGAKPSVAATKPEQIHCPPLNQPIIASLDKGTQIAVSTLSNDFSLSDAVCCPDNTTDTYYAAYGFKAAGICNAGGTEGKAMLRPISDYERAQNKKKNDDEVQTKDDAERKNNEKADAERLAKMPKDYKHKDYKRSEPVTNNDPCAYATTIDKKYSCQKAKAVDEESKMISTAGNTLGTIAVNMMGSAAQTKAQQEGTQTAALNAQADTTRKAATLQDTLGAVSLIEAARMQDEAKKLKAHEAEIRESANKKSELKLSQTGGDGQSEGREGLEGSVSYDKDKVSGKIMQNWELNNSYGSLNSVEDDYAKIAWNSGFEKAYLVQAQARDTTSQAADQTDSEKNKIKKERSQKAAEAAKEKIVEDSSGAVDKNSDAAKQAAKNAEKESNEAFDKEQRENSRVEISLASLEQPAIDKCQAAWKFKNPNMPTMPPTTQEICRKSLIERVSETESRYHDIQHEVKTIGNKAADEQALAADQATSSMWRNAMDGLTKLASAAMMRQSAGTLDSIADKVKPTAIPSFTLKSDPFQQGGNGGGNQSAIVQSGGNNQDSAAVAQDDPAKTGSDTGGTPFANPDAKPSLPPGPVAGDFKSESPQGGGGGGGGGGGVGSANTSKSTDEAAKDAAAGYANLGNPNKIGGSYGQGAGAPSRGGGGGGGHDLSSMMAALGLGPKKEDIGPGIGQVDYSQGGRNLASGDGSILGSDANLFTRIHDRYQIKSRAGLVGR